MRFFGDCPFLTYLPSHTSDNVRTDRKDQGRRLLVLGQFGLAISVLLQTICQSRKQNQLIPRSNIHRLVLRDRKGGHLRLPHLLHLVGRFERVERRDGLHGVLLAEQSQLRRVPIRSAFQ